ncbi:MAG: signal peptide peptidase SppA [Desulfuromonadaceae bacterium]
MKKRPLLMSLLVLGVLFIFFWLLVYVTVGAVGSGPAFHLGEKVGVIEVSGVIASSKLINEQIEDFKEDSSIKAVVLRVESPGGGVGPSQEIHEEIRKLAKEKPVVVSMGSVAASGGYYISAPANQILANPGTITGSIGVIMEFTNIRELLDKIGLDNQVVKSGKHKDIGSPIRPMTEADRIILQSLIDDVHQQFVAAVAEGRKLEPAKVKSLADGRIYTGRQALELGLVDKLGNLQDAIDVAAKLAGLGKKPKIVYPARQKMDFIDYFVEETVSQFRQGIYEQSSGGLKFLWSGVE